MVRQPCDGEGISHAPKEAETHDNLTLSIEPVDCSWIAPRLRVLPFTYLLFLPSPKLSPALTLITLITSRGSIANHDFFTHRGPTWLAHSSFLFHTRSALRTYIHLGCCLCRLLSLNTPPQLPAKMSPDGSRSSTLYHQCTGFFCNN